MSKRKLVAAVDTQPINPSSIATTRAKLRARRERKLARCARSCLGWSVFESDRYGTQIEACDACNSLVPARLRVTDDDVARLPEARRALAREIAPRTLAAHDVIASLLAVRAWVSDIQSYLPPGAVVDREWHIGKACDGATDALDEALARAERVS